MRKLHRYFFLATLLIGLLVSMFPSAVPAAARPQSVSAYDLINAVNNLRAARGLSAYSINSILMSVAQAHSDYQASIGSVTHYGPGGTRPYQRALAAGYPVAGDLSLGGFFSENIQGGTGLTAQEVVNAWTGDAPHLNTMTSSNLTEVGAGVSCSGDFCYFTLDAAQPSGTTVSYTPPAAGSTQDATVVGGSSLSVVFASTPAEDGSIKHTVKEGEVLFNIALAYKVPVDDIKRLNKLTDNLIYPGDVLIIREAGAKGTATVTVTASPAPTYTPFVFWTVTSSPSPSPTPIPSAPVSGNSGAVVVGIISVAALVLAGVFTAAGARKKGKGA